jgi:hypothetical protein
MSFPSLDGADEFGGLDHLVLPGQDPAVLHQVHAALTAQLQPQNFIERMWVRDMAIQTARAEYLRQAECDLHRIAQAEAQAEATSAQSAEKDDGQAAASRIGATYATRLELFETLNKLEIFVLAERDRVIHQYDNRTSIIRELNDALAMLDRADQV